MMALIRHGKLEQDSWQRVEGEDAIPESGDVVVALDRWLAEREVLKARESKIGVRLKSDESPEAIAEDLDSLSLVALEFPQFRDGRAYSYARMLRDRFGYKGEVRAVGDVLMEQVHFMLRTGFDAFEIEGSDPLGQYETAVSDFSIWYQPTGDGRSTALQRRHQLS